MIVSTVHTQLVVPTSFVEKILHDESEHLGVQIVSYPDPNVRKHYRLQYNTAYIGSGQQVEESCSWNVIGMFDNLGCHSNGYVITIKREVCFSVSVFA